MRLIVRDENGNTLDIIEGNTGEVTDADIDDARAEEHAQVRL